MITPPLTQLRQSAPRYFAFKFALSASSGTEDTTQPEFAQHGPGFMIW